MLVYCLKQLVFFVLTNIFTLATILCSIPDPPYSHMELLFFSPKNFSISCVVGLSVISSFSWKQLYSTYILEHIFIMYKTPSWEVFFPLSSVKCCPIIFWIPSFLFKSQLSFLWLFLQRYCVLLLLLLLFSLFFLIFIFIYLAVPGLSCHQLFWFFFPCIVPPSGLSWWPALTQNWVITWRKKTEPLMLHLSEKSFPSLEFISSGPHCFHNSLRLYIIYVCILMHTSHLKM